MSANKKVAKRKAATRKVLKKPVGGRARASRSTTPSIARRTTKKAPKKKAPRKKAAKKVGLCFVIMPFGDWFDDYYSSVYVPAIQAAGLEPRRADDLYRPSSILNDIWRYTKKAKLIVADLTHKNPNVFYELGLCHACANPAILVAESMEDVPFDLRALRVLEYDKNDPNWGSTLKRELKKAIEETLESPLSTVLPTFLGEKDLPKESRTLTKDQKQMISLQQDVESLRRELRSRVGGPSRRREGDIGPERARELIRDLLAAGRTDEEIISLLTHLGPPAGWVERELGRCKRRR